MKPHAHAKLIKAWADGAVIEEYNPVSGKWAERDASWPPDWNPETTYRVQPPQVWFRVGWINGELVLQTSSTPPDTNTLLSGPVLVPVTRWQKVEAR